MLGCWRDKGSPRRGNRDGTWVWLNEEKSEKNEKIKKKIKKEKWGKKRKKWKNKKKDKKWKNKKKDKKIFYSIILYVFCKKG